MSASGPKLLRLIVTGGRGDRITRVGEREGVEERRPRRPSLRRNSIQKVSASEQPISTPSTSRRPSELTPTAMITATETMRWLRRTFT
jgi:hypothetical protein